MVECRLVIVPPGGGEADYSLDFDLPAVPRTGEFISVSRDDREYGYECFYVRSVWWEMSYPSSAAIATKDQKGKIKMIAIEAETARGPHMTKEHERMCDAYEARGKKPREFDATMY